MILLCVIVCPSEGSTAQKSNLHPHVDIQRPFCSRPMKLSLEEEDARGASKVRHGTSSVHVHPRPAGRNAPAILVVQIWEDFYRGLPGGFCWALLPTQTQKRGQKIRRQKSATKSGGSKIKIRENLRSAKLKLALTFPFSCTSFVQSFVSHANIVILTP